MMHLSSKDGALVALPLMRALTRADVRWGCFITNDGVQLLDNRDVIDALNGATHAAVCEHSWDKAGNGDCPIEKGSQTTNSLMMTEAARVVSL